MKKFKSIPSHYRQLRAGETIRRGDLYKSIEGEFEQCHLTVGNRVGIYYNRLPFYRRRHVAVNKSRIHKIAKGFVDGEKKKKNPIEKNPMVTFLYPNKKTPWITNVRTVCLIGVNGTYLVGLDVSDKNRFKKFLCRKVKMLNIKEFNPSVIK